jgi:hypothetical protein
MGDALFASATLMALPFLTKTEGHAYEEEIIGLAWPESVPVQIPLSHRQDGAECAGKRLSIHSSSCALPDPRSPYSLAVSLLPLRVSSVQPGSDSPGQNS